MPIGINGSSKTRASNISATVGSVEKCNPVGWLAILGTEFAARIGRHRQKIDINSEVVLETLRGG
jgi:hypothetical protein